MAPSSSDLLGSGTTRFRSKSMVFPKPWQRGHAPYGLLKENRRGSGSWYSVPSFLHSKLVQNVKASSRGERQNTCGDFVGIVPANFRPALNAESLPAARKKQPQVIVNFRSCRNVRARIACGIFLANRHGRSDAGDLVDIRFFHAF